MSLWLRLHPFSMYENITAFKLCKVFKIDIIIPIFASDKLRIKEGNELPKHQSTNTKGLDCKDCFRPWLLTPLIFHLPVGVPFTFSSGKLLSRPFLHLPQSLKATQSLESLFWARLRSHSANGRETQVREAALLRSPPSPPRRLPIVLGPKLSQKPLQKARPTLLHGRSPPLQA